MTFDVCRLAGLTGDQGVMIPHQNVKNLMLRQDVVEAVKNGEFHIFAVKSVDDGIEILTGQPPGDLADDRVAADRQRHRRLCRGSPGPTTFSVRGRGHRTIVWKKNAQHRRRGHGGHRAWTCR